MTDAKANKMKDGIVKRGSTWSFVIYEKDPVAGKSKQRWKGGYKARREAVVARDAARAAQSQGTYVAPQNITVSEWLNQWIEAHEVVLKPSTAWSYRSKIRLYLDSTVGHERLQRLSVPQLSRTWKDLLAHGGKGGKPLSHRTVQYARQVMHEAMADAVVARVINVNPVVGSKLPKRDGKPTHTTWTGSQLATFLEAGVDARWMPLWHAYASTGMRRGEVAGLRWRCVDLDAKTIAVEVSTTQLGQKRVTTTPKNHERRTIAIDNELVAVLRAWKAKQAAERLHWGADYADEEGLVFTWDDGRPILPDYITKTFGKIQAATNARLGADGSTDSLPRLTVHELRHTHATILLRSRVPVHIVAKRLGHRDPSVTLDTYADVIPDDDVSAVDVFRSAVWGA